MFVHHQSLFLLVMLAGPDNPSLFRPPSCGAQAKTGRHSRTEVFKPDQPTLAELLHDLSLSSTEELFFMQLPDCMPGKMSGPKVDPAPGSAAGKATKRECKPEDKRTAHQVS